MTRITRIPEAFPANHANWDEWEVDTTAERTKYAEGAWIAWITQMTDDFPANEIFYFLPTHGHLFSVYRIRVNSCDSRATGFA